MATMYLEKDVNSQALNGKCVAVIGYGSQGRGQSLNLRDSGLNVILGLRKGGKSWDAAKSDGWEPRTIEDATKEADIICLLTPDLAQPGTYKDAVEPHLKDGATILFAHGFNIRYESIVVPEKYNVIMVAPKGPGTLVRTLYEEGAGVPALIAIHQDATGNAKELGLAFAWGIGSARAGIIETTFGEETETDLFGEQAVLCGGLSELIVAGWETLVEAGYQPEVAYFECLHEVKLIVDLIFEGGIERMLEFISDTAAWGDFVAGKRVIGAESRAAMKELLAEIQDGRFAKRWMEEEANGYPDFKKQYAADCAHKIEVCGKELRKHFSWLKKDEEVAS